jgi:hypothetical protein
MRRWIDDLGQAWDVVAGRESWGALLALFVPVGVGRPEPVRQAPLRSAGYDAAQRELDSLDDAALAALFRSAKPKET